MKVLRFQDEKISQRMPQRSRLIPDLCSLCHTISGLSPPPAAAALLQASPERQPSTSLGKFLLLRSSRNCPPVCPQHLLPWLGCSAVGHCYPCGISKQFWLCADPGDVSADTSGVMLLPTGRGCPQPFSWGPTDL